MPIYLVDRDLPGITMDQLWVLRRAATEVCATFTEEGRPVRYVRSAYTPGESHCMCLFEAANPQLVQELNEVAHLPYNRILNALDLGP
jgi:Protein of unknown function (DUF4242)